MTKSRILIIVGVALLATAAIYGLARKTEVASQPYFDPASVTAYPASNAALPYYASRPSVRTIEQAPNPPSIQSYVDPPRRHHREFVKKRSRKHSVAIVAGSAGVGAAVGALAGGGKGAGIGALAGGAGGFVYDRLTHKKVVQN